MALYLPLQDETPVKMCDRGDGETPSTTNTSDQDSAAASLSQHSTGIFQPHPAQSASLQVMSHPLHEDFSQRVDVQSEQSSTAATSSDEHSLDSNLPIHLHQPEEQNSAVASLSSGLQHSSMVSDLLCDQASTASDVNDSRDLEQNYESGDTLACGLPPPSIHYTSALGSMTDRGSSPGRALDDLVINSQGATVLATKISQDMLEKTKGFVAKVLASKEAVAVISYDTPVPRPYANDIWPHYRHAMRLPARYSILDKETITHSSTNTQMTAGVVSRIHGGSQHHADHAGRPEWRLPVEIVEIIAEHLNRDDIKALRMVNHELDRFVSRVLFRTVVVPFNTEICGMLGLEPKSDTEKPVYSWKNINSDELYDGHGLDVFKGFGKHIRNYGMSFEVSEESLAMPPEKIMTESKTTFWGQYDWPYEQYSRFDEVAGLESAADETPRMKIVFSELSSVKALALSVDSGLGWLNGPDRSIRARVLQRPPAVFGNKKAIPDRRAQAQQGLWDAIEMCHQRVNSNARLATLYRVGGPRALSEHLDLSMLAEQQPEMPYLDWNLIDEAPPYDAIEANTFTAYEEPGDLKHMVLTPVNNTTGILFSSNFTPTDVGQVMSPVIPTNLTQSQKQWLLESEWAQRAFMSSYLLSIIDNPSTFHAVHTLNIPRLPDRYLSALDRHDFWNTLPNLVHVTLLVLPGWRRVYENEAGFVETLDINPASGVDQFHQLLRTHVAPRSNIRKLTIGWATGGEHQEGLHGRNQLLLPSPLMQVGVYEGSDASFISELLVTTDTKRLDSELLHFSWLEKLVLKNCWVTPTSLLRFIKTHDACRLKHLLLDSVSLTAKFRRQQHACQGFQPVIAMDIHNAGGIQTVFQGSAQILPHQQYFLQSYIQTLQLQLQTQQNHHTTALHAQLQQRLQHLQSQINPLTQAAGLASDEDGSVQQATLINLDNAALVALVWQVQILQQQIFAAPFSLTTMTMNVTNTQPHSTAHSPLRAEPRKGSWVDLIDQVSPGANLSDFNSEHSQADPKRVTSLQTIGFVSCGYARLQYAALEQFGVDNDDTLISMALLNPTFTTRYVALEPAMLSKKWAHLGVIVQCVNQDELAALDTGWNLKTGWKDTEAAKATEFDGLLPGGTGRFTGIIRHSDRMSDAASLR